MDASNQQNSLTTMQLITVAEAAQLLGCSRANIYGLIESGELPVVPVGTSRGYRIDLRDIEEFVRRRKFSKAGGRPGQPAVRQRLKHIRL